MEHVFKSKYRKPIGGMLILLAGIITSAIIFCIVFTIIGINMQDSNAVVYSSIITLVVFLLIIYRVFGIPLEYIVNDKEVIFMRKGKEFKKFPYSDYILSSYVMKHSTNGIPTNTSRFLVADDGKKEKKFVCALSKKDFDEFMGLIIAYSNRSFSDSVTVKQGNRPETSNVNKEYFLNKEKIFKKLLYLKSAGFTIIAILCVVIGFILLGTGEAGAEFLFIGAIICMIIFFLVLLSSVAHVKKTTPERVSIRNNAIYIDDVILNFSEIEKISITPHSYYHGSPNRILRIAKREGGQVYYTLGFKVDKVGKIDSVFPQYDEFSFLLEGIFMNTPGKFQYDL